MIEGPSPRVRGIHALQRRAEVREGSIPACAGNPPSAPARSVASRVHPRVCGESSSDCQMTRTVAGPSPRVRGIRRQPRPRHRRQRSIPACAGNPIRRTEPSDRPWVHPRVCGESQRVRPVTVPSGGPSPRVRGIPGPARGLDQRRGSIPACAGNPSRHTAATSTRWVHPRVCGESAVVGMPSKSQKGPSPRVRGIRGAAELPLEPGGSIPACAGNPGPASRTSSSTTVHPRVCGESHWKVNRVMTEPGPSPRVRGIHGRQGWNNGRCGSIPACAGNPASGSTRDKTSRVHPRVCGESSSMQTTEPGA